MMNFISLSELSKKKPSEIVSCLQKIFNDGESSAVRESLIFFEKICANHPDEFSALVPNLIPLLNSEKDPKILFIILTILEKLELSKKHLDDIFNVFEKNGKDYNVQKAKIILIKNRYRKKFKTKKTVKKENNSSIESTLSDSSKVLGNNSISKKTATKIFSEWNISLEQFNAESLFHFSYISNKECLANYLKEFYPLLKNKLELFSDFTDDELFAFFLVKNNYLQKNIEEKILNSIQFKKETIFHLNHLSLKAKLEIEHDILLKNSDFLTARKVEKKNSKNKTISKNKTKIIASKSQISYLQALLRRNGLVLKSDTIPTLESKDANLFFSCLKKEIPLPKHLMDKTEIMEVSK